MYTGPARNSRKFRFEERYDHVLASQGKIRMQLLLDLFNLKLKVIKFNKKISLHIIEMATIQKDINRLSLFGMLPLTKSLVLKV